ncbi:MAG: LLM class flavin-dependent oxidoreductase [Reyranellaceae bacterium]
MMLGLFLPVQSGGWSPSLAPRGTDWSFDYNLALTRRAEALGFDLVFGQAQWLGAEGYGGETRYRAQSLDPFIVAAGLSAATSRLILISTLHILYGPIHPLQVAKFGATIDHMSKGRWGLNVVTGFAPDEFTMFGMAPIEHDLRYAMAAEFTDAMELLWRSTADVDFRGRWWTLNRAFVSPRPVHGRPLLVNAASSPAGLEYAAKYADMIFITSPGGAEIAAALESLPAHTASIKGLARRHGREVATLINPLVICRETEREARNAYRRIVEAEDGEAVDRLVGRMSSGSTQSWRGHQRDQRIAGGNVQLIGSPDQIVESLMGLQRAGCDGVQLCFFDFAPELEFFGERVVPLMRQAGLRAAMPPVGQAA